MPKKRPLSCFFTTQAPIRPWETWTFKGFYGPKERWSYRKQLVLFMVNRHIMLNQVDSEGMYTVKVMHNIFRYDSLIFKN